MIELIIFLCLKCEIASLFFINNYFDRTNLKAICHPNMHHNLICILG